MKPTVIHPADITPHDRGHGVRTTPLVTPETGATEFLNGTTEFAAGAGLPLHSHNCEESVLVLEGLAIFDCGDQSIDMDPGDITWVPPNVIHRFRNRGGTTMRILWTYGRADADRTRADTGETSAIAAERRP